MSNRNIIVFGLGCALALALGVFPAQKAWADGETPPPVENPGANPQPNPEPTPEPTIPRMKEWTMLVFLNGHNNLDNFGTLNMNQMEAVGSTDQVNVVVQWATMKASSTKRYYITKDNDLSRVTSPAVDDPGLVDMGKRQSLVEFVRWAKAKYPAKRYLIDVWNHGSGWRKEFSGISAKDISYDDRFNSQMTTEELGLAMKEIEQVLGQKVDIYASDACLMAMAEVAGEMAPHIRYFVGSQDLEPGEGWPYKEFLTEVTNNPSADAPDVAKALVQTFYASYSAGGSNPKNDVTMSAWNMAEWGNFTSAVRELGASIASLPASSRSKNQRSINGSENYYESDYRDLQDFVAQLKRNGMSTTVNLAADTVGAAMRNLVVSNARSSSYRAAHGLSIWLPNYPATYRNYIDRYRGMIFDRETSWSQMLDWQYR